MSQRRDGPRKRKEAPKSPSELDLQGYLAVIIFHSTETEAESELGPQS